MAYELGDWDFVPGRVRRGLRPPLPSRDKAAATLMPCSLTFLYTLIRWKMGLSHCTLSAVAGNSDLRLFDPTRITGERFAIPAPFSLPFPTSDDHEGNQMKHQLDATLCRFYFYRVTLHVSGASAHHQEYLKLVQRPLVHVLSL